MARVVGAAPRVSGIWGAHRTEMSTADPSTAAGAAPGAKQEPVVPDMVVYACSCIIVVVIVGGVITLALLMKSRLDFKILKDDDPFPEEPVPEAKQDSQEEVIPVESTKRPNSVKKSFNVVIGEDNNVFDKSGAEPTASPPKKSGAKNKKLLVEAR
ncbi:hypothetical protein IscW_ISCW021612 [Ixodes scapularis]|uniref:Uncharacterized protein n=1 Tax=Ixodes scapularis TaxID=6945 RepID=B7Q8Q7_IXOSC|nr:hypothetical protein IscW_ISCW021612 [Ixodes scapularis]|eukprot:XP_002412409.1 hypothetical protein IscW_ISCW021612 [Ixodes scapularis]